MRRRQYVFRLSVREPFRPGVRFLAISILQNNERNFTKLWLVMQLKVQTKSLDFEGGGVKVKVTARSHISESLRRAELLCVEVSSSFTFGLSNVNFHSKFLCDPGIELFVRCCHAF